MSNCPFYSSNIIKQDEINNEGDYLHHTFKTCQHSVLVATGPFHQVNIPKECIIAKVYPIETAQKWLAVMGKNERVHEFPLQTILPKVQMTRHVPPKTLPRDVEVDRRRRQYAEMDLVQMLQEAGLTNEELLPTEEQYYLLSENAFKHFLPLSFFDDTDYDLHSPEAWLKLGIVDGASYTLPAKAFLPKNSSLMEYSWQYAAISQYNEERQKWTAMILADEKVYEVPTIQIMFLAQNPSDFVQRLRKAVQERNTAESLMMMEAIVDCVLLQDMSADRFHPNKGVEKLFRKLGAGVDAFFLATLRIEVYLVFEHLMACYEFEKFVKLLPKEFPAFGGNLIDNALPRAFHSRQSKKESAMIKALQLNMKQLRYRVKKATLYYTSGGIDAMQNVVVECQYIETLSMFVCSFAKPLPLSDFLQAQQQNSNNVAAYLKTFWPQKISSGICLVLRALGKGWLDISLDKWSVYQMCKISRFILQTKFRMQESMQVLLEKSIENFTRFLADPCLQFLELQSDYKWRSDFINSEFPYPKPVFSIVIGVTDEREVFYSTSPEEFQPALLEIFKKALEKTSGVRCIDAETMQNLRFAPNLFIQTVELIEDLYIKYNELLDSCYTKGIFPLVAYAKLYERFINFYLMSVNRYITDYADAKKSSVQVKLDILEHKRQKEELRAILPATITIGPFLVIVDPMKQFMIRKHIEIVKRLFEYYVDRMYTNNEALLDQCLGVYNKISERPQSIEHLYEIRDFSLTVPDLVEQLKADIQIMWLEYDMLDTFFYNLSDAQFAMKWEVYAWPHNIMMRLSTLREEQKIDIEDFLRIHLSECIGFEERLESLNEEIQAFSLQFDPTKVMETAVDVKKTWKIITDLQKQGAVLVFRQELFELEELSLQFLESIIEGFTPYRNLWSTCADLVKLQEATVGNPLINIELEDVWHDMEEIRVSLNASYGVFYEKPEIQEVAITFLAQLDEFVPQYKCIKALKNEHWLFMHWQELAARSGMEIKYSTAMNFMYCIKKGILEHLELVTEISEKAEREADAIRAAMEEEERQREFELQQLLMRKAARKCRTDIL